MQKSSGLCGSVLVLLLLAALLTSCATTRPRGTPATDEDITVGAKALHAADVVRQQIFDYLYTQLEAKKIPEAVVNAYHRDIEPPLRAARLVLNDLIVAIARKRGAVTHEQVLAAMQDLADTVETAKQFARQYGWKEPQSSSKS